ncbi:MAG: hypothetical protein ABEJ82_03885 [Haloplanus sp.]
MVPSTSTAVPADTPWNTAALAAAVGVAVTVFLAGVVVSLGYPVGSGVAPVAWRYAGLAVTGFVATFLSVRYRLVTPAVGFLAVTVSVAVAELTPPGPTFSTLGGYTVVENGNYVASFARGWYVWASAFGYAGVAEFALRDRLAALPRAGGRSSLASASLPLDRGQALRAAAGLGAVHGVTMAAYAVAVHVSNLSPLVLVWIAVGTFLLAAVPAALLLAARLFAPFCLFVADLFVLVRADFYPSPDGPVPVYVVGWFFFLGVFLAVGGVEAGIRRLVGRLRAS